MARMRNLPVGQNQPASGDFPCPFYSPPPARWCRAVKTGAAFWTNIQARFDLETAEDALAPQIKKIASYEELQHEPAASRLTR
jgi:hypothetical protein